MDRIREAVTKARRQRTGSADTSGGLAAPAPRFSSAPSRGPERFIEAKCDFDRFGVHRIISNEQDPVLNSYRILRTRVLQKMEENNWRTLAIVSPGAGAGKSVTAANLAISIGSKEGSRATLVDLDFYRPKITHYLGIKETPSIIDFFEGTRALHDVTLKPDLADVLVIGNERVSRRGAEFLTSAKADELIARTVNEYASRVVIFDMSPLLGCDDTIAFLPKVDCVLLIVASGQTRVPEFTEAQRLLGKTNVIGTVLNKAPSSALVGTQYYY
jgi:Mrp family chromosome partitioning ATPase